MTICDFAVVEKFGRVSRAQITGEDVVPWRVCVQVLEVIVWLSSMTRRWVIRAASNPWVGDPR